MKICYVTMYLLDTAQTSQTNSPRVFLKMRYKHSIKVLVKFSKIALSYRLVGQLITRLTNAKWKVIFPETITTVIVEGCLLFLQERF